ncbi:hypothetical protein ACJX0J_041081, partial [Zea mays]
VKTYLRSSLEKKCPATMNYQLVRMIIDARKMEKCHRVPELFCHTPTTLNYCD